MDLFSDYEHVFIFGSVLKGKSVYNDLDILIIYKEYSGKVNRDIRILPCMLERLCGLPIDLTVLSIEEEKELDFLGRLKMNYLKIK